MGKSAPAAPDPRRTAAAQTATNIGTAIANNTMGNVNQVTPYGSLNYDVSDTVQWTDPNSGKVYDLPRYTATQSFTPEGQAIVDAQMGADLNLAQLAQTQSGRLQGLLDEPVDLSNEATEARLMELSRARVDPALQQRREAMQVRLANQGISLGSAAYDRAMTQIGQDENDAYNQMALQGRQQAISEAIQQRQQPINEIIGISNGTQLQAPQFVTTNQAQIGTPDIAGLTMAKYQADMNAYNQRQASLGGLFGTVASGIMMSDMRVKTDVVEVGRVGPIGVYEWRYNHEPSDAPRTRGFIAQEVLQVMPGAVSEWGGILMVDNTQVMEAIQ